MCTLCACVCTHLICVRHSNVHGSQNAALWSQLSSKFAMVDIWLEFCSYLNYLSFKHDEYFMYLEKNPWNSLKKATESCFQLRQLPGNFWDSGNYRAHKIRNDTDQSGHWVFEWTPLHFTKLLLSRWTIEVLAFYLNINPCGININPKHRSPRKWIHMGKTEVVNL